VWKKAFICSEPCNKVYHWACLEKMIHSDSHQGRGRIDCAYCRREVDIDYYLIQITLYDLQCAKNQGYDVADAVASVHQLNGKVESIEDLEVEYYLPNTYIADIPKNRRLASRSTALARGRSHKTTPRIGGRCSSIRR
jgi:hypothetical protein